MNRNFIGPAKYDSPITVFMTRVSACGDILNDMNYSLGAWLRCMRAAARPIGACVQRRHFGESKLDLNKRRRCGKGQQRPEAGMKGNEKNATAATVDVDGKQGADGKTTRYYVCGSRFPNDITSSHLLSKHVSVTRCLN